MADQHTPDDTKAHDTPSDDEAPKANTLPGKPAADQPEDGSRGGNILAGVQLEHPDTDVERRDT